MRRPSHALGSGVRPTLATTKARAFARAAAAWTDLPATGTATPPPSRQQALLKVFGSIVDKRGGCDQESADTGRSGATQESYVKSLYVSEGGSTLKRPAAEGRGARRGVNKCGRARGPGPACERSLR